MRYFSEIPSIFFFSRIYDIRSSRREFARNLVKEETVHNNYLTEQESECTVKV